MALWDRWSLTTAAPWNWLSGALGWGNGGTTSTGENISTDQAQRLAAVQACIRVLADSEESLPIKLWRKTGTKEKEEILDDEFGYAEILSTPTPWMNGCEFRGRMATERLVHGNSMHFVNRVGRKKRIAELIVYEPGAITVCNEEKDGRQRLIRPLYRVNGEEADISKILHFRGPVLNGYLGVSPITYAASSIHYARELEKYGVRMQKNGGKPGGVLTLGEGNLSEDRLQKLRKSINETYSDDGAGKVAVVPNGAALEMLGIKSSDAQFIENRKFQRSEIAGIFRVPPHMIGDLEHATFSNIEHQAIQFVTYSLMVWLKRTEATLNSMLLTKQNRADGFFFKYDVKDLLRGDAKSRADFYKVMEKHMYSDEVRAMEDMNPLPNGEGQKVLVPLNMFSEETNEPNDQNT